MKTLSINLYEFNELSEKAKDEARNWFREGNDFDSRYSSTFDDAKTIGLNITGFNQNSHGNVENFECEFIDGAFNCAMKIIENHGADCDTYKAAKIFDNELGSDSNFDDIETDFMAALIRAYSRMLQNEIDYSDSNEYIDETIKANEYTFLESGKRFG